MGIFSDNCDRYWAAGLPVIPLRKGDKMPELKNWPEYAIKMPDEETRQTWKETKGDGNIGLVLGPQSGLVAMDIDTVDPHIQNIIYRILPKSPWERIGQKGKVLVYKYTGQPAFRLRTAKGETLVELLANRLQIVLPPSIHPKTGLPYVQNRDLVEVLSEIPTLPKEIESILRGAFAAEGIELATAGRTKITDFVPAGARDTSMTGFAGYWASGVRRGDCTLLEAFDQMQAWVNTRIEKVWGDDVSADKGKQKIVEFLLRDVLGPRRLTLPSGWDTGIDAEMKKAMGLDVIDEGSVKKSPEEILAYYGAEINKPGAKPGSAVFLNAVDRVMSMVAANPDIRPIDQDRILKHISDTNAKQVSVTSMKREIARLQRGDITGNDHTEIAKAVLDDLQQQGEVRYWADKFWQYQGASWSEMDPSGILKLIAENYGQYPAAKRASDHSGIFRVLQNLCQGSLKTSSVVGINFVNGYLTEDLNLVKHQPEFGCTYCLPYPYLPENASKALRFHEMLIQFWGEDEDYTEKVEALREAIAVTMFGMATLYQRCFLLMGVPFSGKSRILEILKGIMPENCYSTIHPKDFSDKFAPAVMQGKLMNIGGDLSERYKIDGGRFKEIIEGAEIEAQHKNKPLFRFRPIAAQWFASNHLPKSTDMSAGFIRRWQIFRFNKPIPPEKRKIDIVEQILLDDREAIAAWAVQGILSLKARPGMTFTEPTSHKEALESMAQENNSVRFFLQSLLQGEDIILGEKAHIGKDHTDTSVQSFHKEFSNFCMLNQSAVHVGLPHTTTLLRELANEFGFQVITERRDNIQREKLRWLTFAKKKGAK